MRSGICPKCHEASVHVVDATKYADNYIPVTGWTKVYLEYYICVTCGYTEMYVPIPKELAKVREKAPRVPSQK